MDCTTELESVVAASCDGATIAGLRGEVILLPFSGIDYESSVEANNVLSDIALKEGYLGAKFETMDQANSAVASLSAGTYFNTMQHDLTIRALLKDDAIKSFFNNLLNSRVVAIVKNFDGGTDGKVTYEVYGWNGGLKPSSLNYDSAMSDNVVCEAVLGNDDIAKEKSLPKTLFSTSVAATEALVVSLYTEDDDE